MGSMAKIKGMSIFAKTGLLAFCLFGIISVSTSTLTAYTLYTHMTHEFISKGSAIATSIAETSQDILLNRDSSTVQAMIDQYLEIEGVAYVFVKDSNHLVISHTFVPQIPPRLNTIPESRCAQLTKELDVESYGRIIDISAPILAGAAGYVHVGMNKELIMAYFWEAVFKMQILLSAIFVVCVIILFVITRRISRPLIQLTEYAERLAVHDFSATIDIHSNDELNRLGRAMQSMARELSALFSEMEKEVAKTTGDLQEHMAYLAAIIDNLVDGLLVIDPMGKISILNPAMREFFDLGDKDYRGFSAKDVFPTEVSDMTRAVRSCDNTVQTAELPLSRERTGKAVGSSISVEYPTNQCLGGVLLIRDITREKELDQLKTDFISTVSHELRTPMTSVLGFAKIIRKKLEQTIFPALTGDTAIKRPAMQVKENMDIIVTEAERLTELINDVLDIAKMEAGKIQWRDQVVFMTDVIRQSVDSTRGLWMGKGLDLQVETDNDLPPVRGDRGRLVQVMVNLISNSIKFTTQSPIIIRAHMDGVSVMVSVEDHGSGIDEDDLDKIFEKFKQVGDTLTEKPAGTGLGLPICRQIVEHHHGRIWAESEKDKGSIFSFSIPSVKGHSLDNSDKCKRIMPEPDKAMLIGEAVSTRTEPLVLVVDDDPTLGKFLRQVFEENGFRVAIALNGEEAIELTRDLAPNLITMDLMMPGLDGHTAIKCLRSNPFTCHIPILVLSALTDAVSAGGDIALTKPVDDARLVEVVRALLLEKDLHKSCLILSEAENGNHSPLSTFPPEETTFCPPEDIWKHVQKGFTGTIFIPAELEEKIDIDMLSRLSEVTIVLLPPLGSEKKSE